MSNAFSRPHRQVMKLHLSLLLLVTFAAACSLLDGEARGTVEVRVETDSTRYVLHDVPGHRRVELRVALENRGTRAVYLHRACGYGEEPSAHLVRTGDVRPRIDGFAVGIACKSKPLRPPIRLAPGEARVEAIRLSTTESPFARYPTTADTITATYRLEYDVQRSDEVRGRFPVDLVDAPHRISNELTVVVPRVRPGS